MKILYFFFLCTLFACTNEPQKTIEAVEVPVVLPQAKDTVKVDTIAIITSTEPRLIQVGENPFDAFAYRHNTVGTAGIAPESIPGYIEFCTLLIENGYDPAKTLFLLEYRFQPPGIINNCSGPNEWFPSGVFEQGFRFSFGVDTRLGYGEEETSVHSTLYYFYQLIEEKALVFDFKNGFTTLPVVTWKKGIRDSDKKELQPHFKRSTDADLLLENKAMNPGLPEHNFMHIIPGLGAVHILRLYIAGKIDGFSFFGTAQELEEVYKLTAIQNEFETFYAWQEKQNNQNK